jgi:ribose/xylose/arabinose/galactoside ABC-type transport system permease subunit
LEFQRTLIPIALTLGLLLFALGAAQWLAGDDQPYSAAAMRWSAIALPIMGLLLLVLAATLMISVKRKLDGSL